MDDLLDMLLPSGVMAMLIGGAAYFVACMPWGGQTVWIDQAPSTQAERAAIQDCFYRTEDVSNGEFTELDTRRMRECKKTIGGGKKLDRVRVRS